MAKQELFLKYIETDEVKDTVKSLHLLLRDSGSGEILDRYRRLCALVSGLLPADSRGLDKIAKLAGMNYQALYRRARKPSMWTPDELIKVAEILGIP